MQADCSTGRTINQTNSFSLGAVSQRLIGAVSLSKACTQNVTPQCQVSLGGHFTDGSDIYTYCLLRHCEFTANKVGGLRKSCALRMRQGFPYCLREHISEITQKNKRYLWYTVKGLLDTVG